MLGHTNTRARWVNLAARCTNKESPKLSQPWAMLPAMTVLLVVAVAVAVLAPAASRLLGWVAASFLRALTPPAATEPEPMQVWRSR